MALISTSSKPEPLAAMHPFIKYSSANDVARLASVLVVHEYRDF